MALCALRVRISRLAPLAASVCLAASLACVYAPSAQARYRHHWRPARTVHVVSQAVSSAPPEVDPSKFSAIVVDANTGRELYGVNENALRHPASVTKVMTLYLLFEKLEKGELTLSSQIPVSQHAAGQEPSKLGLAPWTAAPGPRNSGLGYPPSPAHGHQAGETHRNHAERRGLRNLS